MRQVWIRDPAGNVIVGHQGAGVYIAAAGSVSSTADLVAGNWIGASLVQGSYAAVPNAVGVESSTRQNGNLHATKNLLQANQVAGNTGAGILIKDAGITGNVLTGNWLGLDATGTKALPNGTGVGRITIAMAPNNDLVLYGAIANPATGALLEMEKSTDGGVSWQDADLRTPAYKMAHTRFGYHWNWSGKECTLMSRCTDELGTLQPTRAEIAKYWNEPVDKVRVRGADNSVQPWRISSDGSVHNGLS